MWRTWVSLNPDNDSTAIWLEKKFNIPASGNWIPSSTIFGIPIGGPEGADASVPEHPGLVVFECSPLDGLEEIEKCVFEPSL